MRTVWLRPSTATAGGVNGYDGGAAPPAATTAAAGNSGGDGRSDGRPDADRGGVEARGGVRFRTGAVIMGGADGTVSSPAMITGGTSGAFDTRVVGGIVRGLDDAYVALDLPEDSPMRGRPGSLGTECRASALWSASKPDASEDSRDAASCASCPS